MAETDIANTEESADPEAEGNQPLAHLDMPDVVETAIVPPESIAGNTVISEQVIMAIVGSAIQEIQGVTGMGSSSARRVISETLGRAQRQGRGVSVVAGQREAILSLEIQVAYGVSIPEVARNVRQNVAARLLDFCGLIAKEIDIAVTGIDFSDERRRALSDTLDADGNEQD